MLLDYIPVIVFSIILVLALPPLVLCLCRRRRRAKAQAAEREPPKPKLSRQAKRALKEEEQVSMKLGRILAIASAHGDIRTVESLAGTLPNLQAPTKR